MELALNLISKTYKKGSVKALDNFSVTLTPGVYGLLGPNGAGKTTTISLLSTLLLPTKGEILIGSQQLTRKRPDLKRKISVLRR